MKKLILCLIIVLAAFTAFGCGDDEQKDEEQAQKQDVEEGHKSVAVDEAHVQLHRVQEQEERARKHQRPSLHHSRA